MSEQAPQLLETLATTYDVEAVPSPCSRRIWSMPSTKRLPGPI